MCSAELVQDYWLTLPADCRLAAMAVAPYLPGISASASLQLQQNTLI